MGAIQVTSKARGFGHISRVPRRAWEFVSFVFEGLGNQCSGRPRVRRVRPGQKPGYASPNSRGLGADLKAGAAPSANPQLLSLSFFFF